MAEAFHMPVMAERVTQQLVVDGQGVYVDGTVGGGGHAEAILRALDPDGWLVGLDRDAEAVVAARVRLECFGPRVVIVQTEFWRMNDVLRDLGVHSVDGVLLDLGVSSHQIEAPYRGFSYSADGPLDMRMSQGTGRSAADVVHTYSEDALSALFFRYGEDRWSRRIARAICAARRIRRLDRTSTLREVVLGAISDKRMSNKTLSRIFQALRIEVNDELDGLRKGLDAAVGLLREGRRMAVLSYHSLEDRIVKSLFVTYARGCRCPPDLPVCVCGGCPVLRVVGDWTASEEELAVNRRARSARLRVAEKIGGEFNGP